MKEYAPLVLLCVALGTFFAHLWLRPDVPGDGFLLVTVPAGASVAVEGKGATATSLKGVTPMAIKWRRDLEGVVGGADTVSLLLDRAGLAPVRWVARQGRDQGRVCTIWLQAGHPTVLDDIGAALREYLLPALSVASLIGAGLLLWRRRQRRDEARLAVHDIAVVAEGGRVGQWRLEKLLGAGAMAEVFKARSLDGREPPVALKILFEDASAEPELAQRFEREVDIGVSRLNHPGIVRVHATGSTAQGSTSAPRLYLVMEFVDGHRLTDRLEAQGPLPITEAVTHAKALCDALACAHEAGIIHRDLKPDNILIPRNGPLKISDFGLARGQCYPTVTGTGTAIGTPLYMPPEQVMGSAVDGRADLYSLGCILYQMLTGTPPFGGDDPMVTLMAHLSEVPRRPDEIRGEVPVELSDLVMRLLEKDPADRWRDARTLAVALDAIGSR